MKKLFTGLSSSLVIGITCILLLSACSSPSEPNSNYYLFSQPKANVVSIEQQKIMQTHTKQKVKLKLVLAQYLNQPNIVLQKADQSLHYAPLDLWAAPLKISVFNALISDFNQQNETFYLLSNTDRLSANATFSLNVNIEYFHVDSHSEVILSGVYQWYSTEDKQIKSAKTFYFKTLLEQDGYSHTIKKMRSLILSLSKQISDELI